MGRGEGGEDWRGLQGWDPSKKEGLPDLSVCILPPLNQTMTNRTKELCDTKKTLHFVTM